MQAKIAAQWYPFPLGKSTLMTPDTRPNSASLRFKNREDLGFGRRSGLAAMPEEMEANPYLTERFVRAS